MSYKMKGKMKLTFRRIYIIVNRDVTFRNAPLAIIIT